MTIHQTKKYTHNSSLAYLIYLLLLALICQQFLSPLHLLFSHVDAYHHKQDSHDHKQKNTIHQHHHTSSSSHKKSNHDHHSHSLTDDNFNSTQRIVSINLAALIQKINPTINVVKYTAKQIHRNNIPVNQQDYGCIQQRPLPYIDNDTKSVNL